MGRFCVVWFQVTVGIFIPFLLQTVSLFSNFWVYEDDIQKGLFFQKLPNGSHTMSILDSAALGLTCTSFSLQFLFSIVTFITVICFGPDCDGDLSNDSDDTCICCCGLSYYCGIILYIIASFFSFGACVRIGILFPTEFLGPSFFMCLASFLIIWLMCLCLLCDLLCKKSNEKFVFKTLLKEMFEDMIDFD